MSGRLRITDLSREELRNLALQAGLRAFRGDQVYHWVMQRGILDPAGMSDLPSGFRDQLTSRLNCSPPASSWESDFPSGTEKLYQDLGEGDGVESVLIAEGSRTTACLSSQVGCPVKCAFCASGLSGLRRNLTRGEILGQFLEVRRRAREQGRRIRNVVMMGMGEPLLNYGPVMEALEILNDPKGGAIGARHITISTVGIRKGVERLAESGRQYTLAFSLHAPDDGTRGRLIPFPGAMTVEEMAGAARHYLTVTGREVTFEYVLLHGVNASPDHARQLGELLQGVRGTVNLIPYNENPECQEFRRPSPPAVDRFAHLLRRAGIKVSVRKRKGHRILAACGQLRLRHRQTSPESVTRSGRPLEQERPPTPPFSPH